MSKYIEYNSNCYYNIVGKHWKIMDSNYYDEERMSNEINEALNYDPDAGFNDVPDHSNDPYEYLSN